MAKQQLLTARTEFASALNQICAERGISPESVLETIRSAILAAYRKDFEMKEDVEYLVELDSDTGAATVFELSSGKKDKKKDVTPPGFGRIAAQTAKQVILQQIREEEKSAIIDEYKDRVGTLVSGMVLRFDGKDVICDIGRGQGRMTPSEQVPQERYRLNQRLTFYISAIKETAQGKQIIVSRSANELVALLFKREVPEVNSGVVEIKKIAREPGSRTKIAVASTQAGVDPVGSCVGQKGVRVQAVIEELNGEKIDVIPFSEDPVRFITAALSPAENLKVTVDEDKKTAVIEAEDDQLSLTIGKEGQNVRLASKLTGHKIDVKGSKKEKEEEEKEEKAKAKKKAKEKKKEKKEEKKTAKSKKKTKTKKAKNTKAESKSKDKESKSKK